MYSNDILFSLMVSHFSERIQFVNKPIYCVYESPNSLMRNTNWKNPYIRTKVGLKAYDFLKSVGVIPHKSNPDKDWVYWTIWWNKTKEINIFAAIILIPKIYLSVGNAFPKYLLNNRWQQIKSLLSPYIHDKT